MRLLAQIKKCCENNPDILVVATGDTSQLPPIVDYTNTKVYKEYADECINLIFHDEIYLTENKRLKTEKDRKKLKQLKEDIFNEDIPLETTVKKYFDLTQSLTLSKKGIAYLNDTCKEVSKHIRKQLNKTKEYEVGEILTCREYTKLKAGTFNVNCEYEIIEVTESTITIVYMIFEEKI